MDEEIIPWQKLVLYHKVLYLDHLYDLAKETDLKTKVTNHLQHVNWKFTVNIYIKGSGTHISSQDQSKRYHFQDISYL